MTLVVGETLDGRYRLMREIAHGARNIVFEAQHLVTKRSVALKVPTPRATREHDGTDLLLVEARLLTEARHPCVVAALDAGKLRSGALSTQTSSYLVMEMLEARPLSGVLTSRGQLSVMDTLRIGLPLCDALSCIHRAGVVHGDLRPGNVFVQVSRQGAYDPPVRLIDFGAAARAVTGVGQTRAGTDEAAFRSPEQLAGDEATDSSDVFALAVLLYECLTGKLPFPGPDHASQMRVPPVAPHELRPDIPAPMNDALVCALAFDPAQRFADAGAFARALRGNSARSVPTSDVPSTQPSAATLRAEAREPHKAPAASEPPAIEIRVVEVERGWVPERADPSPGTEDVTPSRGGPIPAALQAPKHDSRRRHQRAAYLTPVRVIREGGPGFDARSEDISEGGMLLIGPHLVQDAEPIEVRFALPITGEVITTRATSRWIRAAREGRGAIGVQFQALPDEARQNIANYVQFFGSER